MNERLTELYRSCRPIEALASQDQFKSANVLLGTEVEKFAELIVRECAGIYSKIDNGNQHMGTEDYLEALQKHFGVEE
jgi:hypothetical protein